VTNNPGVPALFRHVPSPAIFYSSNASALCAGGAAYVRGLRRPAGVRALMADVAAYHTYLSRMHAMLHFLLAAGPERLRAGADPGGFDCA
jgi:hypothetical protein